MFLGSNLGLASWVADAAPVLFKLSLALMPAPAALPPARPAAAVAAIASSAWSVPASLPLPRARGLPLRRGKGPGARREVSLATPARRQRETSAHVAGTHVNFTPSVPRHGGRGLLHGVAP